MNDSYADIFTPRVNHVTVQDFDFVLLIGQG